MIETRIRVTLEEGISFQGLEHEIAMYFIKPGGEYIKVVGEDTGDERQREYKIYTNKPSYSPALHDYIISLGATKVEFILEREDDANDILR